MPTAEEVKGRIDSVENVRKITKTMKAVASAKLSKAKKKIVRSRPYARAIESSIRSILERHDEIDHPYFYDTDSDAESGEEAEADFDDHTPIYLVMTGDRGLCGSFNSNVQRHMESVLEERENVQLFVVGKRGLNYFEHIGAPVAESYTDFWDEFDYSTSRSVTRDLLDEFELSDATSVTLVYNEFESAMVQNVVEYPLLPLNRTDFLESDGEGDAVEQGDPTVDFLYEPSAQDVIEKIFPKHVKTQVYVAMLESDASEQGARMVAMDNATENANEMIEDLTLDYNQIRQQTITREIAEIVGGAEALKG
jgi:F-type H+-transporting ATPase subunit gamma